MRLQGIFLTFLAFLMAGAAYAQEADNVVIEGDAIVRYPDQIVINGQNILLWGIDAPNLGSPYAREAQDYLETIARYEPVRCYKKAGDEIRMVAQCINSQGRDLAKELVSHGFAINWSKYSCGLYAEDEAAARKDGLAMWAGGMVSWRAEEAGLPAFCDNE